MNKEINNKDRPCITIRIFPIEYDKKNPSTKKYDPREIMKRFINTYDPENFNAFCYIFDKETVGDIKPEEYGLVFIEANCSLVRTQD